MPLIRHTKVPPERRVWTWRGHHIPFLLQRSMRKTLSLRLDGRGVRVGVPLRTSDAQILRFLSEHGDWLLEKWAAIQANAESETPLEPVPGTLFPFQGAIFELQLARQQQASWGYRLNGQGVLTLPRHGDTRARWLSAIQSRALAWFQGRVSEYCFRLGVTVPQVRLTRARTRWGSCSLRSGIRLHWRLIHFSPYVADYVVAHEVAHLLHMNHGPDFWRVLEQLYPQAKSVQATLRSISRSLPVIDLRDAQGSLPGFDTI